MELCELTLAQAAAAIANREISPLELTKALLARIAQGEPQIQAWETIDEAGALTVAKQREADVLAGHPLGLLHGVPVGVKDIFCTAGLRTSAGFGPFDDFVPKEDARTVALLRRAGAIVLGKTVTTQFAFVDPPRTTNPWNANHTPGGSSSGSGAAVAGRMVPAALGSQTAGSVLRPAAYCGVVGFKPGYGRVSCRGVMPLSWSFDHVGFLVRRVEDAALLLEVLAGDEQDQKIISASPPGRFWPMPRGSSKKPRLAFVVDFWERAESEVREHLVETVAMLKQSGALIEDVRLPASPSEVAAIQQVIMQTEVAAVHSALLAKHPTRYGARLRSYVEVGQLIPGQAYIQAQRLRRRLRSLVEPCFDEFDALLLPTVSNVAPGRETTGDPSFQAPWTMLGFPAISLPSGLSRQGLPLAIQLVGAPLTDDRLLKTALWCEEKMPAIGAPPDSAG